MSGRVHEQLPTLLALAYDRSEEARLLLAEKLANLFLTEDAHLTANEERELNDLIDLLLKSSSSSLRRKLAERFAATTQMPRRVALRLVKKDISVAARILETNETFTDDDLITVVRTESMDHACAIARRKSINEAVTDALVTTGDVNVMRLVAENLGAKLSPKGLTLLVETSRVTESLQKPLMYRPNSRGDFIGGSRRICGVMFCNASASQAASLTRISPRPSRKNWAPIRWNAATKTRCRTSPTGLKTAMR